MFSRNSLAMMMSAAVIAAAGTGCVSSADVRWDRPAAAPALGKTVYLAPAAVGGDTVKSRVGQHTFTVFAIPAADIRADGKLLDRSVSMAVTDALTAAGYDVRPSADAPPGTEAVVKPTIDRFHYWSYSWLWPFMFQGGEIKVRLNVGPEDGTGSTYEESFGESASWFTLGASYRFDENIRKNMTGIVNAIKSETRGGRFAELAGCPVPPASPPASARQVFVQQTSAQSAADRLKALRELKDSGIINETEYETRRKALLEQL
jgi:hypothetical protein